MFLIGDMHHVKHNQNHLNSIHWFDNDNDDSIGNGCHCYKQVIVVWTVHHSFAFSL